MKDTESFQPVANTLTTLLFNPSAPDLPRLSKIEDMYERYRIIGITVKFVPATATTTTGSLYFAISPGPKNDSVKAASDIIKMRPSRCVAVWQSASISVGQTIDSQRYMHCGRGDTDGIAFTMYYHFGNTVASGNFQVTYNVEFAYPKVF